MSNSKIIPSSFLEKDWFYQKEIQEKGSTQIISGAAFQHLAKALRKREGEKIVLMDGLGKLAIVEVQYLGKRELSVEIQTIERIEPNLPELILYVGLTQKPNRNEWMLEKVTEFGVARIQPLLLERTGKRGMKPERMQKILIAACEQSHQAYIPILEQTKTLDELNIGAGQILIAHCEEDKERQALVDKDIDLSHGQIHVFIGPEGDFSPSEIEQVLQMGGEPISLGEQRLRTETAAISAISYLDLKRK